MAHTMCNECGSDRESTSVTHHISQTFWIWPGQRYTLLSILLPFCAASRSTAGLWDQHEDIRIQKESSAAHLLVSCVIHFENTHNVFVPLDFGPTLNGSRWIIFFRLLVPRFKQCGDPTLRPIEVIDDVTAMRQYQVAIIINDRRWLIAWIRIYIPEYNVVDPLLFEKVSPTVDRSPAKICRTETHVSLMGGPNH